MAAWSLIPSEWEGWWGEQDGSQSFHNLISEVTYHQFCHMLLVIETNPGRMWEGTIQGYEYQEMGIPGNGNHWEMGIIEIIVP